jgi:inhibitor of KinA sporulation pathway (predicted exonuclease)
MNYIVFDLEWNQPPSWDQAVKSPLFLVGEIIEIGAVKLDEKFQLVDEKRLFVTPQYYKKMHKEVAALTGIRDSDLAEKGMPFPEAYEEFIRWCGDDYAFMTWSMNDVPMLIDNMSLHGMDVSQFPDCYDIQRIFSREIMRGQTRYSLETALTLMREKGDSAHDALHDARNTAKICDHLELENYIGEYTSRIFAEPPSGRIYETRYQILSDPQLKQFTCPWCGRPVSCEPWVSLSGSTHWGYGMCSEGDEFLVELGVVHQGRREFSVKRLIFEMSDDLWDIYMDKKEALGV